MPYIGHAPTNAGQFKQLKMHTQNQNDNQLVISGGIGSRDSSHSCDLC